MLIEVKRKSKRRLDGKKKTSSIFAHYLLFPTVTWAGDAPTDPGGDRLGTSIRHLPPGQSVTCPEFLLDVLELDTFYDNNCRADSGDFNASKIIRKYEGLTRQLRWGILTVLAARSPSCQPPSPARINSCALTTPHTLGGIIVALIEPNSMLSK